MAQPNLISQTNRQTIFHFANSIIELRCYDGKAQISGREPTDRLAFGLNCGE
jgi:hypothetical protein